VDSTGSIVLAVSVSLTIGQLFDAYPACREAGYGQAHRPQ
jgi:hypothetical protein